MPREVETVVVMTQQGTSSAGSTVGLAYVVDGDMTFLGFKGGVWIFPIATGEFRFVIGCVPSSGFTHNTPTLGNVYIEGRGSYELLWGVTGRVTSTLGLQYIPIDIKTQRRMMEGDKVVIYQQANTDSVVQLNLHGKIMGLSDGGHWEGAADTEAGG